MSGISKFTGSMNPDCVISENILTPTPSPPRKFLGGCGLKDRKIEKMYGVQLEFPERWGSSSKNALL